MSLFLSLTILVLLDTQVFVTRAYKIVTTGCPTIYAPVCSTHEVDYKNLCFMEAHGGTISHYGECHTVKIKTEPSSVCPKIYRPVCAINGRTYNNTCLMGYKHFFKHDGVCLTSTILPDVDLPCPSWLYRPVCGTNGKTYDNSCHMKDDGAKIRHSGRCLRSALKAACPKVYSPVCDTDGRTHNNTCLMKLNYGNMSYAGKCRTVQLKLETRNDCPRLYHPVCATNGKTYANSCVMKSEGAKLNYDGECLKYPRHEGKSHWTTLHFIK